MDFTTQLHLLERDRDAAAARLAAICREPNPFLCDGVHFVSWRKCSVAKGQLTEMLLARIEDLTSQINALVFGVPHAA